MPDTATTTEKPADRAAGDLEEVFEHLGAIKQDLLSLAGATRALAKSKAKRQLLRVSELADTAADTAAAYREQAMTTIKEHPFAAVGVGLLAGFVLAAALRRS